MNFCHTESGISLPEMAGNVSTCATFSQDYHQRMRTVEVSIYFTNERQVGFSDVEGQLPVSDTTKYTEYGSRAEMKHSLGVGMVLPKDHRD